MNKPEIIVRPDGVYELTLAITQDEFSRLLREYQARNSLMENITGHFAKAYVEKNFSELSKLIDLDLVKLLATRKLAGVVAEGR